MELPTSKTVRSQVIEMEKKSGHRLHKLVLRFDDQCGNGYNVFGISVESGIKVGGEFRMKELSRDKATIAKLFPGYEKYLKWHLVGSTGPMHYIANTTYWAKEGNLEFARSSAVWPEATLEELSDKALLMARMTPLMNDFKADMEEIGFTY